MSRRNLKTLWTLLIAAGSLLVVEHTTLPTVSEFLATTRSEVRSEDLPSLLDGIEARRVIESSGANLGSAGPKERGPGAREAGAVQPFAADPNDPKDEPSIWRRALAAIKEFGLLFVRTTNLSWTTETPDEDAAQAATIDAYNVNAVENDPVIPHTGEMTFRQPIVRIPGTGFDFTFELSYRSNFQYDGPVGHRWEHNWNARFRDAAGTGDVTRIANNRRDIYDETGEDSFTPRAGSFEKSVTRIFDPGNSGLPHTIERRLQDGTLEVYTDPDGNGWYYLDYVNHRDADNQIDLTYDGSHVLTKITDTRGRWFELKYDGYGRLTKFEDHSGGTSTVERFWSFIYDGSYDLTTLVLPVAQSTNRTMAFAYSSHKLTDVMAPRESHSSTSYLHMDYNGSKVTSQRFGATGQNYTLSYASGVFTEIDREGTTRIYNYNTTSKAMTSIETKVLTTSYGTTSYAWDAGTALLTKVTFPEGNGIRYVYDNGRLTTMARCTEAGLSTSISWSGSDHLVTEYKYQASTNWTLVTKVKDPRANEWSLSRDSLGNITSYLTPEQAVDDDWVLGYDESSRLVNVTDPEGRLTTYVYSSTGILSRVEQDVGAQDPITTYHRDIFENVTKVTDPEAHDTFYERNELGYVTKVKTHLNFVTEYKYDLNNLVTEVLSDNNDADMPNSKHKVVIEYNILDLSTKVKEYYAASWASSRVWTYGLDKEDRVTLTTLPESARQIKVSYDARGLEVTLTSAYGTSDAKDVVFEYDKNRRMTKSKDGLGNATTMAFDQFDRLTKVTDPESHYATTDYDKNSNVLTTQSWNSGSTKLLETSFIYDDDNLLITKRQWAKKADLSTSIGSGTIDTVLTYDKAGLLKTKADPCGCGGSPTTYFTYDAASRLVTIIDALGQRVRRDLKKDGRVTKVSQDEIDGGTTRTYVTEYAFNNDGHLTDVSERGDGDETALTTTYTVDAMGRVKTLTDPLGNLVAYRKDDFGRVITVLRKMTATPTYIETRTVYDLNDNVLTKEIEKGGTDGVLRYVYDNADRMITSKDEGNTDHEVYIWDNADNLSLLYDRNGSTVTFTYDKLNQLTRKDYTKANGIEGPSLVKFWYDGVGRIVTAYNQDSRIERKWNTLSKLEQDKVWVMPSAESGTGSTPRDVDYTYDANGLLSMVEYPDNATTKVNFHDQLNRITQIKRAISTGQQTTLATWAFQGPARMKTLEFGNGTKETMAYDLYGRATTMLHDRPNGNLRTSMYEFRRGYDAASRPTYERRDYYKSSDGSILNGQRDFGDRYYYDAVNRLTKVIRGVGYQATQSHSLVESAAEDTLNYVTRTEYTLDASGNRQTLLYWDISGGASRTCRREDHTFDIENQLNTRVEHDFIAPTTTTKTYTYDKNGSNVSSTDLGSFNVDMENRIYKRGNWYYRYDAFGRRIEKRDSGGSVWFRYYYDGVQCIEEFGVTEGNQVPEEDPDPFWKRVYGPYLVDQMLWGTYDQAMDGTIDETVYFHLDYLGSVIMLTEDGSNPAILETYRYDEYGQSYIGDGNGNMTRTLSVFEQDKLYTGRRFDCELDLYYYRARYRAADLGLFQSRDAIEDDAAFNRYIYVRSSPIASIDPSGRQSMSGGGALITARNRLLAMLGVGEPSSGSQESEDRAAARAAEVAAIADHAPHGVAAFAEARAKQSGTGLSGEALDAWLHCYWMCLTANWSAPHSTIPGTPPNRIGNSRGAIRAGDAREEVQADTDLQSAMDRKNNRVGAECVVDLRNFRRGCEECCWWRLWQGALFTTGHWIGGTTPPGPEPEPGNPNPGGGRRGTGGVTPKNPRSIVGDPEGPSPPVGGTFVPGDSVPAGPWPPGVPGPTPGVGPLPPLSPGVGNPPNGLREKWEKCQKTGEKPPFSGGSGR